MADQDHPGTAGGIPDPSYPVEVVAPDITPYRAGNTGVDYMTSFAGAGSGPHVMVTALTHGNEPCGAIALDRLLRSGLRPRRGRLTLGFMNVAAYRRFDPAHPMRSRYVDQDFNRLWSPARLDGPESSSELRRARQVRPILDRVDYLLDLHSMQHPTTPLVLSGPCEKGQRLAREIGFPAHVVRDAGHAEGPRMRDYGPFAVENAPQNALLVECGQHWSEGSARVATETVFYFLVHLGVIDRDMARRHVDLAPPPSQRVIEVTEPVTADHDDFTFTADYRGMEVIAKAGTVIGMDGEKRITTPYDDCVLIMPSRRLRAGGTAVRFGRLVT